MRAPATAAAVLFVCAVSASAATPAPPLVLGPYRYDGTGNIKAQGDERFTYDALGRVTYGTSQVSRAQRYTYDGFGNLTKVVTTGFPDLLIDVDWKTNRLATTARPSTAAGTYVYGGDYDAAGNQLKLNGGDAATYAFDPLNATTETKSGTAHRYYLYDADDERVAEIDYADAAHATWNYAVRDGQGKVLRELRDDVSGGQHQWRWLKDYVYGDARVLEAIRTDGTVAHMHLDHLYSPILLTDGAGQRLSLRRFFAFGVESTQSKDNEELSFGSHERDADGTANALDYVHARYYLPNLGRFLSVDPAMDLDATMQMPQMWSRYSYVAGNPLTRTDPDGRLIQFFDGDYTKQQAFDEWLKTFTESARKYFSLGANGVVAMKGIGLREFRAKFGEEAGNMANLVMQQGLVNEVKLVDSTFAAEGGGANTTSSGLTTHIEINPKPFRNGATVSQGGVAQTLASSLAHELLGHGYRYAMDIDYEAPSKYGWMVPGLQVKKEEAYAIWAENRWRATMHLPLRRFYVKPGDYVPPK